MAAKGDFKERSVHTYFLTVLFIFKSIMTQVLPCAASGDMCWCERLWIWCLYAYTANTSTMMHPMMPPATGPTGALLIMFNDATSSSVEATKNDEKRPEERLRRSNGPVSNSSGSFFNPCCDAGIFLNFFSLVSAKNDPTPGRQPSWKHPSNRRVSDSKIQVTEILKSGLLKEKHFFS